MTLSYPTSFRKITFSFSSLVSSLERTKERKAVGRQGRGEKKRDRRSMALQSPEGRGDRR